MNVNRYSSKNLVETFKYLFEFVKIITINVKTRREAQPFRIAEVQPVNYMVIGGFIKNT